MIQNMFLILAVSVGSYIFILTCSNLLFLKLKTRNASITEGPLISVCIPVRNEQHSIGACIESLLDQSYENYEILLVDDNSTDETWNIINSYAQKHRLIRAIKGKPLPESWNGKPYAMSQLVKEAKGQFILFTDADTNHCKDSISFAYTNLITHKKDLLSGYPRQCARSKLTSIIVSAMNFNLFSITPLWVQYHLNLPALSLAIGQFLFVRSSSLQESDVFSQIRKTITDDIHIARILSKQGFGQLFLDVSSVVSCRMYDSPREAYSGISRNIIDFFDNHSFLLILVIPLAFLCFLAPSLCLAVYLLQGIMIPSLLIVASLLPSISWGILLWHLRYPKIVCLLFPFTLLFIISMCLKGVYTFCTGKGFLWKGRYIR